MDELPPPAEVPDRTKADANPEPSEVPIADEPPRWPIHQRLIGAGVKAAFATVGALPLAFFILAKEFHRWEWEWLWGVIIGGMCGMVVFASEQRGSKWWATALRLSAAGICVTVLTPLAIVWLDNLGDPAAAYNKLVGSLRFNNLAGLLLAMVLVAIAFPLMGVWIFVRNRTASLLPQICAGALTMAPLALVLFADQPSRNKGWAFFCLVTGVLIPLGTSFADRFAKRWDPDAPLPGGGDLRTVWAVSGVITWLAFSLPTGPILHRVRRPYDRQDGQAMHAMRSLTTAQLLYSEGDKDADGAKDFAGSITELNSEGLIGRDLGGATQGGYVFRLIRSSEDPEHAWAAAADPILPHLRRHFVTNHAGVVYYTYEPIPLDPKECALPKGLSEAYR